MNNKSLLLAALAASVLLFSCKKDEPAPSIYVDSTMLTFEIGGGSQTLSLSVNGSWTASADSWLTVSPSSGSKSDAPQNITVTAAANTEKTRSGSVSFSHSGGRTVTVNVTQIGRTPENELPDKILEINFKKTGVSGFSTDNKTLPSGISSIWSYNDRYGMVATAYANSTNYAAEGWFISPEIDLTERTIAYLSFSHVSRYSNNPVEDFTVYVTKDDGKVWVKEDIPNYSTGEDWTFVGSGDIDLAAYCGNKIKVAFVYRSTAEKAGTWEIESMQISRSQGKDIDNGDSYTAVPSWLELPEIKDKSAWHAHTVLEDGKYWRNWSMLYDESALIASWVAYPLCDWYTKNTSGRTDAWGYDPFIGKDGQPNLGVSGDFYNNGYDRGHQIPSADRLRSATFNRQTFYFTNMTPQNSSLNQAHWEVLEEQVRRWSRESAGTDTLYVVTGALTSASSKTVRDNDGKSVTVPDSYYKVLLRYDKEGTQNSGYMAAAFVFENRSYPSKQVCYKDSDNKYHIDKSISMSVADFEKQTGLTFFANLVSKVGAGTAIAIKSEKPSDNDFWGLE